MQIYAKDIRVESANQFADDDEGRILSGIPVHLISWVDTKEIDSGYTVETDFVEIGKDELEYDMFNRAGSSGGPIMNDDGYVIGVNLGWKSSGAGYALLLAGSQDTLFWNVIRRLRGE